MSPVFSEHFPLSVTVNIQQYFYHEQQDVELYYYSSKNIL